MRRDLRDDAGLTLVELLVALIITAIIVGPIAAVVFVGVHDTSQIVSGFYENHDPQLGSSVFTTDVQSSDAVYTKAILQQPTNLRDGTFGTGSVAYIVGDGGALAVSSDGGATWEKVVSGVTVDLYSVDAPPNDANHAWAVGDGGVIIHTADGGSSWSTQRSGGANLRAVYFKDANNGIAVGGGGTILRTTNAGGSWTAVSSPTGADLNAITFRDGNNGVVGGSGGVTVWTKDFFGSAGGRGLQNPSMPTSATITGAYVKDDAHGWFSTSSGAIYMCKSGCSKNNPSWVTQVAAGGPALTDLAGVDANHVWAVGQVANGQTTLLCYVPNPYNVRNSCYDPSQNGAATWYPQTGDPSVTSDLNAIAALDATHVIAVGPNGVIESISVTLWGLQNSGTNNDLNAVAFKDATRGWAVGDNGTVLTYNGNTWGPAPGSFPANTLNGIAVGDTNKIYIVGGNGTMLFYNGATVTTLDLPAGYTGANLYGVVTKDKDHFWVVGQNGTWLYCSANCSNPDQVGHAAVWKVLPDSRPSVDLFGVAAGDANSVWAVGAGGTRLFCTDKCDQGSPGDTIIDQSDVADTNDYRAVDATANNRAWAAGAAGDLEFSDSNTWTPEVTGSQNLRAISMLTNTIGLTVGEGGALFTCAATCEQPLVATWGLQDAGTSADLNGAAILSGGAGQPPLMWAVGDGGTIVTTITGVASWSQQDSQLFAKVPAPVCQTGVDPLIAFAYGDASGEQTAASYYLDTSGGGSPNLARWTCTLTPNDPADLSQGYTTSEAGKLTLGHFLGDTTPTASCDGTPAGDPTNPCDGTPRTVTLTIAVKCAPLAPSNKDSAPCPGDPGKRVVQSPTTFTLAGTRRLS